MDASMYGFYVNACYSIGVTTMVPNLHLLEDAVQYAYEMACSEQDYEIAEQLLRALEIFSGRDGDDNNLSDAYLKIAASIGKQHR